MNVIMGYLSSSNVVILFNGGAIEEFQPSRGIRQRDSLSSNILIMCMEILGFMINDKIDLNLWDLVRSSRHGPAFSHFFFAEDPILFGEADRKNCQNFKKPLTVSVS